MTTFYDEIVAGIVTLFKFCMHRDIYENRLIFSTSKIFKVLPGQQFSQDILNSKNIIAQNNLKLHPRLKKN